jgi:CRP-like cAMP-binding protein
MHTDLFDLSVFLASSPLFSGLSPDELSRIAQISTATNYAKGDAVFRVGQPCEAFQMVVSGQVKLFVESPLGHEKVIEIFGAGQSFAEAIMFLDKPYIFNAQALNDVVLLNVSKQGVFSEIARDPKFAMHMLGGVSRRLQTLIQDVEGYALKNGLQRLIGYLLRNVETQDLAHQNTLIVALPASKATIASRLSLTPEYFSRVLHDLEEKHLIFIDRREIRIPDVQGLVQYGDR